MGGNKNGVPPTDGKSTPTKDEDYGDYIDTDSNDGYYNKYNYDYDHKLYVYSEIYPQSKVVYFNSTFFGDTFNWKLVF